MQETVCHKLSSNVSTRRLCSETLNTSPTGSISPSDASTTIQQQTSASYQNNVVPQQPSTAMPPENYVQNVIIAQQCQQPVSMELIPNLRTSSLTSSATQTLSSSLSMEDKALQTDDPRDMQRSGVE